MKEKPFNIDVERFSSFTKLCRATAWVIRFIEKLRKRTNLSGPLKSTEISKAETMWSICTEYSNVIDSISKEKSNKFRTQLGLYIDNNGLIRCKGRLENAEICEGSRYPLLLPKYHRYTDLDLLTSFIQHSADKHIPSKLAGRSLQFPGLHLR